MSTTTNQHVEPTRVRVNGTHVTQPRDGDETIAALRSILARGQYAKIDGVMVDLFTASTIVKVYDAVNDANKIKLARMPIARMASVCFSVLK